MKKIIVTGSCGFIGFNLINSLSDTYKIIGIDSLNNAYDNNLKKLRLDKLKNLANFEFKNINFSNESDLVENNEIFNNCTAIVHLGARAGVRQSFADPEKYLIDNTLGTSNLSLKVKEFEIPRFILASTSSIYGDTGSKLAVENQDELTQPPSVYASTKWAVIGLTKSIASLIATENITSNVICPGLVDTKLVDNEYFLKGMSPQDPTMDALNKMVKQWSPMKIGVLKAENIGIMISRFFDKEMSLITGEVIDVSAGAGANWMA